MLDEKALEGHFDQFGLEPHARERIRWIRKNAPIRSVGGGSRNTPVRFCSRKMGFVLVAEAFTTEYAVFEEYDNDEAVLEFYPQPCRIRIEYINATGRTVHPDITPDIFVIRKDEFAFVECKTEEELLELAKTLPGRYIVDDQGAWKSPPAEIAAAKIGCKFVVRSSRDNNWVALENFEFFRDYLSVDPRQLKIASGALAKIERCLVESNWVTVGDLVSDVNRIDPDSIYALIITKQIYFDFQNNRISNPQQAIVFRDEISAKAYRGFAQISVGLKSSNVTPLDPVVGMKFSWDGRAWQIVNIGDHGVSALPLDGGEISPLIELSTENLLQLAHLGKIVPVRDAEDQGISQAHEILRRVPGQQLQIAIWRNDILFGDPGPENPLMASRPRTRAYWLASFRAAELQYGVGLIGLIPNRENTQGNHNPKCDPHARELAIAAYEKHWETDAQKSITLCHGFYQIDCEAAGVEPISLRSFGKIVTERRSYDQKKKRVGEKSAYNEEPPYLVLEYATPRHGNRPFHIGHIDHTPLPIKVKDKTGKQQMETIWLTLLIDAFSRYVLAIYLSFDSPSYASCMMVIRECIRKHGRMPNWIVVDNGAEFGSTYFELLLARLRTHKKSRPKGKPKYGSVIERMFRTATDQFVSNLLGATHDMNPRQVGRDVDPSRKAVWTMERLWVRLLEYLSSVYHKSEHSTLGQSPESAFIGGLKVFGYRSHSIISYTEDFLILTCPSSAKGTAVVSAKGVKINYTYYRCEEMDLPGLLRSRVEIRYDPDNYGIAYAFIRNRWMKCYSEYYAIFQNYTEKQIRNATSHLRLKARMAGRAISINAQILATFLSSTEAEEVLRVQKIMDSEGASVKATINLPIETKRRGDMEEETPLPNRGLSSPRLSILEDF